MVERSRKHSRPAGCCCASQHRLTLLKRQCRVRSSSVNHQTTERYAEHQAAEKIERAVHSVTIGYRLTLSGAPPVEVASWHQDPALEHYTVRVRTGGDELTLTVQEWGRRTGAIGPFLRQWIIDRVHLEQSKLRSGCRRPDPYWVSAWRRVHLWL